LHTILKHGSASLRKPEAHKRLRLKKAHRRLLAWVRGTNIDPQAVARAIELSTTRYCPVIAGHLVISPRTVNRHTTSLYSKLKVSSRAAATHYALEHHLL
jgi:Bacterial regulatory proteins, luxR family